ncbi:MAG: hypothetical protein WKF76_08260 [Nocardioidaceae bacterium]
MTPLRGDPARLEIAISVLLTYAVMGVVDHDRTIRSVLEPTVHEVRAPRRPAGQRVHISTGRLRVGERR